MPRVAAPELSIILCFGLIFGLDAEGGGRNTFGVVWGRGLGAWTDSNGCRQISTIWLHSWVYLGEIVHGLSFILLQPHNLEAPPGGRRIYMYIQHNRSP